MKRVLILILILNAMIGFCARAENNVMVFETEFDDGSQYIVTDKDIAKMSAKELSNLVDLIQLHKFLLTSDAWYNSVFKEICKKMLPKHIVSKSKRAYELQQKEMEAMQKRDENIKQRQIELESQLDEIIKKQNEGGE